MILYVDPQSPYAYLAAARAERVLGVSPRLQPIALGAVMVKRGWGSWAHTDTRDEHFASLAERVPAAGLPPIVYPSDWPAQTLAPARATAYAHQRGAARPFLDAYWALVFAQGRAAGDITTIEAAAGEAGLDPEALRAGIEDRALKDALRAWTDAAWDAGVRGVPTLAAGGELYFGDDRLEAAAEALRD